MRVHYASTIVATAAVTIALTIAISGSDPAGANDAQVPTPPTLDKKAIDRPTLHLEGCEIVLATDRGQYEAGDVPRLELLATNPTDQPVAVTVALQMLATAPMSPMARVMPMPEEIWKHDHLIELKPGEKKTIPVEPDLKLPKDKSITLTLGDNQKNVVHRPLIGSDAEPFALQLPQLNALQLSVPQG